MENEPVNVNDFKELARRALPKMYYDFYSAGAEDEHTLKENIKAFSRISIRPRILVDVSHVDLSTTILGHHISVPIMVAPTAYHKLAHPEGEIATAKAAAACNTIMVLSFSSNSTLEEVAASCTAVRFFQLYEGISHIDKLKMACTLYKLLKSFPLPYGFGMVFKNREVSAWLVQRAEKSGYKAIVVTVDTPRLGRREVDIKNKMIGPQVKNLEGFMSTEVVTDEGSGPEAFAKSYYDASFSWKDINWLKSITKLPILIKGVLTHEDATRAAEAGVAGIIVSNHGARQLDYAPATISVLEEVVHAVGRRIPIFLDGGVRRGTDVFKALALGAQAVLIGRPVIYGLAAKGENGVKQVISMLKDELELSLALAGCTSRKDITRNHVRTELERLRSHL